MAGLAILLLFGCCCVVVSSTNVGHRHVATPAPKVKSPMITFTTSDTEFCDREYSCLNCTTARICAPTDEGQRLKEVDRFTCLSSTPWCDPDTGSCTATQPSDCANSVISNDFTCMRNGYFPDLTNCSRYYSCVEDVPYMFTCLENVPYYDPSYQACVSYSYNCASNYNPCSGYTGRKVAVQSVNNLFFDCVGGQAVSVDRCIGAYVFDATAQSCVPHCPHAGLFPSDEDCTMYYRCSPTSSAPEGASLTMTLNLTCPDGQGFLEEDFECVDKSDVPNCQVKTPSLFN